ncbi:uncharacterized protein LOC114537204 [Dendronephthya gigantea]|uniref:uncharacterized protein LOC114537204 n=1 Tax=Dendronephthya gigantea TaxID=151771 RepID=UPI00106D25D8|nr:uncharacterized protein LOC114537204 [Dendronephthya gigantea]
MSRENIDDKFKAMSVKELQKYLSDHGVTVSGHLKPTLINIASSVEKMGLPVDPNFTKDDHKESLERRLFIHDIQINDPFTMKTENNFVQSPPFGLYDIFNHLIYHSTVYDKQGLASYKSYDDYRLFVNGYVHSLQATTLQDCGVHVYVGKVQPSMKSTTDDGKRFYELWFILEGRGPNRGSVIDAFCTCKGGRDGGCKHIAAAMYSLEDLLNTREEDSVTSGPCKWTRKPRVNTEPCPVKELNITKDRIAPAVKAKKRPYQWLQNKDFDPRQIQKPVDNEEIARFTSRMKELNPGSPLFPLLNKLYLSTDEPCKPTSPACTKAPLSDQQNKPSLGIMAQKIIKLLHLHRSLSPNDLLAYLKFSDEEIKNINESTIEQWQSEDWYIHKQGFLSASKCKNYCTRQNSIREGKFDGFCKLAKQTVNVSASVPREKMHKDINNPREWGLNNEANARNAYKNVQSHLHHNVQLQHCGFMISAKKPFMGASLDDIRSCGCITGCPNVAVEYKCPWSHKDKDPKAAFLSKEIGGVIVNSKLCLQTSCKYYYQVQMQMFVSGLLFCDFVVWTTKGIQCATVPYDANLVHE